ncbi:hypothetical protein [Ureibacillus chungkukjangi]|uniref:Uncharacterized protein n=1 Tax=Ureibacillus chungkukjangi TaxID=1202712 RepID=A0A318TGS6_9BACL|nr:hypothetical protein [Ureibacillus chungkukjangi]PYF03733.1 hypothetical protein BJ095_12836 [Ureibacillus chungkukjangi]
MPIKVESIVLGGPNAELFPSSVSSNLNFDALILSGNNAKELSVIIKKHLDTTYGFIKLTYNEEELFNEDFRNYLVLRWVITIDWLEEYINNGEAKMIEPEGISIKRACGNSTLFINKIDSKEFILPEFEFLESTLKSGKYFFEYFKKFTQTSNYENYLLKIKKLLNLI